MMQCCVVFSMIPGFSPPVQSQEAGGGVEEEQDVSKLKARGEATRALKPKVSYLSGGGR